MAKNYYNLASSGGIVGMAGLKKKLNDISNVDLKDTLFDLADRVREDA